MTQSGRPMPPDFGDGDRPYGERGNESREQEVNAPGMYGPGQHPYTQGAVGQSVPPGPAADGSTGPGSGPGPGGPIAPSGFVATNNSSPPLQQQQFVQQVVPLPRPRGFFSRYKVQVICGGAVVVAALVMTGVLLSVPDGQGKPEATSPSTSRSSSSPRTPKTTSPSTSESPSSTPTEVERPKGVGVATQGEMNVPIAADSFEFTITGMTAGITEIPGEPPVSPYSGQFITVNIVIKNITAESQKFYQYSTYVVDSSDTRNLIVLDATGLFGNPWDSRNFGPGEAFEGVLVYEIPADQTPVSILLEDGVIGSEKRVFIPFA